jgi:OmpA-OmpF porin, OOP family
MRCSNKKTAIAHAALAIAIVSLPARAEFYLGLDMGTSKHSLENERSSLIGVSSRTSESHDESDRVLSFQGGYRFSKFIAAEIGYLDLGKEKGEETGVASFVPPSGPVVADASHSREVTGFTVAGVASYPIGKWEPFAKAGGFMGRTKWKSEADSIPFRHITLSFTADSTDLLYGVGLGYRFGETLLVRVEWAQFPGTGDAATHDADITATTAGARFSF